MKNSLGSKMKNMSIKNTIKKLTGALLVVFLCEMSAHAQTGRVTGTVIDSNGEPLIGANVMVANSAIGAATNVDGEYLLRRVPEGDQTINVGSLGYQKQNFDVTIVAGETVELDVELSADVVEGEEVTIYSQALGQARAVRTQLESNSIVNVVSESRLRELPDANAAESIGRLPGVSILRDAGEGQKVAIRGMGPRYSSITIDGNRIPGTDGDRSVDLSMISPEMLSGIEVYKSIRPDMDADAIGGSVNFKMGGAPSETRYRANLQSGYSNHISAIGNYKASFSGSSRFLDDRLGVMASANAQQVDRSAHIFGANYRVMRDAREGEPHAPVEVSGLNLVDRKGTRLRYGGGLSLDWKLPNGQLFFNNTYSRQNRDEKTNDRRYHIGNNRQEWRPRHVERNIYTLNSTLAGEHDLSWMMVDWRMNRSVTSNNTPYDHVAWFFEPSGLDQSDVDLTGGPEVIPTMARNRTDMAFLETFRNNEREQYQENFSASLDIEVPVTIGNILDGYVKLGGKHYNMYRDRFTTGYRVFNWETPDLFNNPDSNFPWVVNESGRASMEPFISDSERSYDIINGNYEMAHLPSIQLVDQMWDNYSEMYRTLYDTRFGDYEATERLSSGYIMTELNIGSRLMILPGIRYEHEHSDYMAKVGEFQNKPEDIDEGQFQEQFTDSLDNRNMGMWFPMVQARYRLTKWFDIRAARTVSTSRPSFSHVAPRYKVEHDAKTVDRGHTQIRPMRSTNYDLFLTFHHNRVGLFTVGGFHKDVEDVIYSRNANVIFPEEIGLPSNTRLYSISEPVNNENMTTVKGFEVEWQSNLTYLPNPFNGLVLNANYSRFFSEANYHSFQMERTSEGLIGVDTFRVAPMVHQADHIANVSVGYDYLGFSSRISMQYQGATLRSIGSRPETDRYTEDYLRFDASIRQRFLNDRLSVFANLHNITNREDRSSQFTYDRPRSIEYYGSAIDIGMELNF
ncbi:MAG: TonB-dependent receptor [Balneolales bacterium]